MRSSNAHAPPGRMSIAGKRSTGLSNRFSIQAVDFRRYSINNAPGTGQRQTMMAQTRFPIRPANNQDRNEQAKELMQFFQQNSATFPLNLKDIRDSPSRNDFRVWFEFLISKLNSKYQMPEASSSNGEEIQAITHCLNYYPPIKTSTILGMTAPHQWPTFLTLLDWLRNLVVIMNEQETIKNENDYFTKYALDCYKYKKTTGSEDFSAISASIRDAILSDSNYDSLMAEVDQANSKVNELNLKLETETATITQVGDEIERYKNEIDNFVQLENELCRLVNDTESKFAEVEKEIKSMKTTAQNLRDENQMLNLQVAAQPLSANQLQDLLQKRTTLRDEFKKNKARYEQLSIIRSEKSKVLKQLATEKTTLYHAFCGFLSETANSFDAEVEYRKFEVKLFGESGGTDSLRAAHLETDVTEAFRNLMNVIRQNIQVRLNKLSKEDVQSRLKEVENKNRMLEQQIKQMQDHNKVDLQSRSIAIVDAQDSLKQVKNEYEKSEKRIEEVLVQNNAICARIDAQAANMKEVEDKLSQIYAEESELLTDFADYMAEVSTQFEAYSKLNADLMKQKEMLLELSIKISEHVRGIFSRFQ